MSINYGPSIVTSGLVLALDAADRNSYPTTGTTWTDLSGRGNNGTLTNGPTYSNGSIVFDGTNDYVSVASPDYITNQFTLSSWVKVNIGAINKEIICRYTTANTATQQFELWVDAAGKINVYAYKTATANYRTSTISINDGLYHNLTGVYSGNSSLLDIYVDGLNRNGTLTGTIPSSVNASTTNIEIGRYDSPGGYLPGNIAQVSIYNRALSATEIQQNFNATRSRFGV